MEAILLLAFCFGGLFIAAWLEQRRPRPWAAMAISLVVAAIALVRLSVVAPRLRLGLAVLSYGGLAVTLLAFAGYVAVVLLRAARAGDVVLPRGSIALSVILALFGLVYAARAAGIVYRMYQRAEEAAAISQARNDVAGARNREATDRFWIGLRDFQVLARAQAALGAPDDGKVAAAFDRLACNSLRDGCRTGCPRGLAEAVGALGAVEWEEIRSGFRRARSGAEIRLGHEERDGAEALCVAAFTPRDRRRIHDPYRPLRHRGAPRRLPRRRDIPRLRGRYLRHHRLHAAAAPRRACLPRGKHRPRAAPPAPGD